jgi:hypothetical protein
MPPPPLWMSEPSDQVPGVSVIMHLLSSSSSSEIFVDSIKVYRDRVYLRIGLKFRDRQSWRAAGIDPNILMMPETFNAMAQYQGGETVLASSYTSDSSIGSIDAISPNASRTLVQISSEGAGLQWYVDYLILPIPTEDVVFSADFPQIGLNRGEWLLSTSTIEECLEIGSRYSRACIAAEEDEHAIKTNLNSIAEIVARLAHLGARVDFGNAELGWEPAIQVPAGERGVLSIYEILSDNALNVTIRGLYPDCYMIELSDDPGMQIIVLRNDVATAAEVLIKGLRQ